MSVKPVTHQANGRPAANVGPAVSVCGPCFCGVFPGLLELVGPLSVAFRPVEHVE